MPKIDTKRIYLTIEELTLLAQTPCKEVEIKQAFIFACNTGLRISDILRLEWQNIKDDKIEIIQMPLYLF